MTTYGDNIVLPGDDFELDASDVNHETTLNEDLEKLARLRKAELELKADYEDAAAEYRRWRAYCYERMEEEKVGSTRIDGVGNFVRKEPTWKPTMQDRAAFRAWARENAPALLVEAEAKGLLNQLVHERMSDGQDLPPGLGAYPDKMVSITK